MATERELIELLGLGRVVRAARADEARRARDVPKRQRQRRVVELGRPMIDPGKTLGHPARGRKRNRGGR